jgi:hypothetical protein
MNIIMSGSGETMFLHNSQIWAKVTAPEHAKPTNPRKKTDYTTVEYMPWGEDNLKPQNVVKKVEANDILPLALDIKARACYGRGIVWGYEKVDEKGQQVMTPAYNREVSDWCRKTNINAYLREASHDLFWFGSPYAEMIKNRKGDKVAYLHALDATTTRMGKQERDGLIKKVYVSANWDESDKHEDILDCIDPYFDMAGQIASLNKPKFIYPIYSRLNGRVAYELPIWDGLMASKWLDLAEIIPQVKLSRLTNNLSMGYHIEIDGDYWRHIYPDWEKKTEAEKATLKKTELENFFNTMVGPDGKHLLMTPMTRVPTGQGGFEQMSFWKVTELKGKSVSDEMLEDSRECDFHIIRATGVDPTLLGVSPGKGHSAGSGSDKRVAFNNLALVLKPDQDRILSPLNDIIIPMNGWNKGDSEEKGEFKFWVMNYYIATLNSGGEISKNEAS